MKSYINASNKISSNSMIKYNLLRTNITRSNMFIEQYSDSKKHYLHYSNYFRNFRQTNFGTKYPTFSLSQSVMGKTDQTQIKFNNSKLSGIMNKFINDSKKKIKKNKRESIINHSPLTHKYNDFNKNYLKNTNYTTRKNITYYKRKYINIPKHSQSKSMTDRMYIAKNYLNNETSRSCASLTKYMGLSSSTLKVSDFVSHPICEVYIKRRFVKGRNLSGQKFQRIENIGITVSLSNKNNASFPRVYQGK